MNLPRRGITCPHEYVPDSKSTSTCMTNVHGSPGQSVGPTKCPTGDGERVLQADSGAPEGKAEINGAHNAQNVANQTTVERCMGDRSQYASYGGAYVFINGRLKLSTAVVSAYIVCCLCMECVRASLRLVPKVRQLQLGHAKV